MAAAFKVQGICIFQVSAVSAIHETLQASETHCSTRGFSHRLIFTKREKRPNVKKPCNDWAADPTK